MRLFKRGLIILGLIIVLAVSCYAQSSMINLSGSKLGTGSNFDGALILNLTQYLPYDSNGVFRIGMTETYEISLEKLISLSGIGLAGMEIVNGGYGNLTNTQENTMSLNFPD